MVVAVAAAAVEEEESPFLLKKSWLRHWSTVARCSGRIRSIERSKSLTESVSFLEDSTGVYLLSFCIHDITFQFGFTLHSFFCPSR